MKYYKTNDQLGVRIDTENNVAFIKSVNGEFEAPRGSKTVADAIIDGNEITQAEYETDEAFRSK